MVVQQRDVPLHGQLDLGLVAVHNLGGKLVQVQGLQLCEGPRHVLHVAQVFTARVQRYKLYYTAMRGTAGTR